MRVVERRLRRRMERSLERAMSRMNALRERIANGEPMRRVIPRNREDAHERLMRYYFVENSVYGPDQFRRRFRMCKGLFQRIMDKVKEHNPYFVQTRDAMGSQRSRSAPLRYGCLRMGPRPILWTKRYKLG